MTTNHTNTLAPCQDCQQTPKLSSSPLAGESTSMEDRTMSASQWIYAKIRRNMRMRERIVANGYKTSGKLSYYDYVEAYRELHRLLDVAWHEGYSEDQQ